MGCFSNCFGKSKQHQRRCRRRSITTTTTTAPRHLLEHLQKYESIEEFQVNKLIEEVETVKLTDPSPEPCEEKREKVNSSERKKVTFNLDVKVYEHLATEDEEEEAEKSNGGKINEKKREGDENEAKRDDDKDYETQSSSSSSLFSYPPTHRYQNCRDSDDEFDEVMSLEESEIDDDDDDDDYDYDYDYDGEESDKEGMNDKNVSKIVQDQSSESLFSLSIDSRKHNLVVQVGEKEVNSPIPSKNPASNDSNRYDGAMFEESVLNPVENMTQWKVIKARSRQAIKDKSNNHAKENVDVGQEFEFGVKEVGVDTSLSTWLVVGSEPATTPNSKNSSVSVGNSGIFSSTGPHHPRPDSYDRETVSPNKFEDRPILGALTIEEIRQFSASNSPRKSPRQSPDDMPIIGSVGSYWNQTGQTNGSGSSIKSRSRLTESTKVVWDPTPFETRLEKALEQHGMTEAH